VNPLTNDPFQIRADLKRYPHRANDPLQAWDAADELILEHLNAHASDLLKPGTRILILNDSFGALACTLTRGAPATCDITSYSDSFNGLEAAKLNGAPSVQFLHELGALRGPFDLVLARIPKNLSFFEDELCRLSGHLKPSSQLICGYMLKHQANGAFELLNRIMGTTRTSLAKKKARLIFASFERMPTPSLHPREVSIEGFDHPFLNHSNLFSREKLDIGTRFLLEHLPRGDFASILDLGCANGIIGIAARQANPSARLLFSDESAMAISSARTNWQRYFPEAPDEAAFHWTHCFENQLRACVDLVLCNPPFHQGATVGDFVAKQMFKDAFHALSPGGFLRVIGNSHLHYPAVLERIFGNSEVVAKNPKFVIVDARKHH
jgi:23S rRNA (guanine1835-N2)-methyltransferase